MKRLSFTLLLLGLLTRGQSQVLINLQLPPSGVTVKSQLWNFSLINTATATTTYDIQVEITLTDLRNNQRILTGTSKMLSLPRGAKVIKPSDVMPVSYNVTGQGVDASPDGFLPVGRFVTCFSVLRINSDITERIAEECETIEVEPISPPILVMPSDSEHVAMSRPLFTWIPPTPFTLFTNLRYNWKLAEVAPLQTGATAIQQNVPLMYQTDLGMTNYQYPMSSAPLDTGKIYAWQVEALSNGSVIANSDVWTFRLGRLGVDTVLTPNKEGFFARLKKEENASFVLSYGKLNFEYVNELNNAVVQFSLWDITKPARREIALDSAFYHMWPGQTFRQLDLSDRGLSPGHTYLFVLTNTAGERWYLKFEYRKPD